MMTRLLFAAMAALALTGPLRAEETPLAPGAFTLAFEDGRVTLRANETPLEVLIRAVAVRAGATTRIEGDLSGPVTVAISGAPVMEAVSRLAGDRNWAAQYATGEAGEPRLAEIWILGSAPPRTVVTLRTDATPPPSDEERERAADLLRRARPGGDAAAEASLADLLDTDESPFVRSRAAMGLGALSSERSAPALEAALDDPNGSVRMQAVNALAAIDGARATAALGEVLLHEPDRMQRIRAAWALSKRDGPLARDYLAIIADDPDPLVRDAAALTPRDDEDEASEADR